MTIEKLGDAITELDSDILDRYFIMKQALIEEQNPKNHIWIKKMARKFGRMHMSTKETSVYQRRPSVAALIAAIVAIILTISVAATALIQWTSTKIMQQLYRARRLVSVILWRRQWRPVLMRWAYSTGNLHGRR